MGNIVKLGPKPVPDMTGAAESSAGAHGLVPTPAAGDQEKFLKGNGTWANVEALPPVTQQDDGKVMAVVNGAWAPKTIESATNVPFDGVPNADGHYF